MKREEAVKVLTAEIDRIEDNQAYEQMSKKMYEDGYKRIDAFKTAIDALQYKSDSVTIKLPDNGLCAIVRKVNGRYEIDTGRVEKWPD